MGRIRRAWELLQASWSVLRYDRELLVLPILSALASIGLIGLVFVGVFWDDLQLVLDNQQPGPMGPGTWVVLALTTYALSYIAIFFNVAMICAADERMSGGDPTIRSALAAARSHARTIAPWALVAVIVQSVIRAIEERGGVVGQIAGTILGVGWALVTYLILPVLVFEGVGVRDALSRSKDLFTRTWGETVSGELGMSLIGFFAVLASLPLLLLIGGGGQPVMVGIAIVLFVLWVLAVATVMSALNAVFRVAVYRYATDGETPEAFEAIDLGSVFPPKRRRRFR